MEVKSPRDLILWVFLAYFFISIFLLGWLLWPFLSTIVMAAVLANLFKPVYRTFKLRAQINASLASLFTCVLIVLIVFIPIVLFVGILSKEAYDLYLMGKNAVISEQIASLFQGSKILERANHWLSPFNIQLTGDEFNRAISELIKFVGFFLYQQARAIASNMLSFLASFFFMLLIIFYLLIDGHKLLGFITYLSPLPKEQDEKLIQKFKDMAGAMLIGNGLSGLIQGTVGGLVFAFFGLESPFLWGAIMSLLAFLPILGIGLVFIPAAIYVTLQGSVMTGVFFLVFYLLFSFAVEYLFKPKLVGSRVKMHPLLVFLAIIGGLKLFGLLGIVYGPLVVTAFLTLTDIYHASYQTLIEPADACRPRDGEL